MKLIIDIPEEAYKEACGSYLSLKSKEEMRIAIKNSTPLPKGHGRLIDADVLVDGMEDNYEFCEVVNSTPTIIEAERGE